MSLACSLGCGSLGLRGELCTYYTHSLLRNDDQLLTVSLSSSCNTGWTAPSAGADTHSIRNITWTVGCQQPHHANFLLLEDPVCLLIHSPLWFPTSRSFSLSPASSSLCRHSQHFRSLLVWVCHVSVVHQKFSTCIACNNADQTLCGHFNTHRCTSIGCQLQLRCHLEII